MPASLRSFAISWSLTRALIRLIPAGKRVVVRGCGSRRIPASIVPYIVDRIDARGIHDSPTLIRLDGGFLHNLSLEPNDGLSLREAVGLYDAGDIGLESAALTFDGDVVIETPDHTMVSRAHTRGSKTGFQHVNAILDIASYAAAISGRRPSGAL